MPIGNPVLDRELRSQLRSRKALALHLVFVIVLCAIVLALWPERGVLSLNAISSRSLFTVLFMGQLVLVTLFSPAFTASCISGEKEAGSFDLLFASLLRPRSIITGKLFSSIGHMLLLVASSLPAASVCFVLGGVDPREMAMAYLVLLAAAVSLGMVGLVCSAIASRSYPATISTYVAILVICAGVWVPSLILSNWQAGMRVLHSVRCFSPFTAMLSIVQPDFISYLGGEMVQDIKPLPIYLAFAAVLSASLVVVFTILVKKRPHVRYAKRVALIDERAKIRRRRLHWPFYLLDPMQRQRMIGAFSNPVRVKESRSRAFGHTRHLIRAGYFCFILSLVLVGLSSATIGTWDSNSVRTVIIAFQLGMVVLVAPSLTSGSITEEREQANLDILRMSLLPPRTIILGKLELSMSQMALLIISTLPMFGMLAYLDYWDPSRMAIWLLILCITALVALAAGLFSSSLFARTPSATAAAYGFVAMLCVGTLFGLFLRERLQGSAVDWMLALNPFLAGIDVATDRTAPGLVRWQHTVALLSGLTVVLTVGAMMRFRRLQRPDR